MPNLDAALQTRAAAVAGLTALIGSNPVKFAPSAGHQGWQPPYVLYTIVTDPPVHTMGSDKESTARVQMDVFGVNYNPECNSIRDELLAAFDRQSFGVVRSSICENRGTQIDRDEPSLIPRIMLEFSMLYG